MKGNNAYSLIPYTDNCPCNNKWLSGFLWGRAFKQGTYRVSITVTSRPRPIVDKLQSLLREEEFDIEELANSGNLNTSMIAVTHPEIRTWKMPPVSRRRIGDEFHSDFFQGFLASKLVVHSNGLSMSGANWRSDVQRIVEESGCLIYSYENQLVVPRSQIHNRLFSEFAISIDHERTEYAEFSRKNEDLIEDMEREDVLERMPDYEDAWASDWAAGFLLSLQIDDFDPVIIERNRFASDIVEKRFIESIDSKKLWYHVKNDKIELSLQSGLVDWLKTSSINYTYLGPEGIAGSISGYVKGSNGSNILLDDNWSITSLPSWMKQSIQDSGIRLRQTPDGIALVPIDEGCTNSVIDALEGILSPEEPRGPEEVKTTWLNEEWHSSSQQTCTTENRTDVSNEEPSIHTQVDLAHHVGTILSSDGPIRLSRLYKRISAEYNPPLPEHTLMKLVSTIIKDSYYSSGDFAAFSEQQYWDATPRIPASQDTALDVKDISVPELAHLLAFVRANSHNLDVESLVKRAAEIMFLDPREPIVRMQLTNAMGFMNAIQGKHEEAPPASQAGPRHSTPVDTLTPEDPRHEGKRMSKPKERIRHAPNVGNLSVKSLPTATIWHLAEKARRAELLSHGEIKALKEYARSKFLLQGASEREIAAATSSLKAAISAGVLDIPCTRKKKPCYRCRAVTGKLRS